MEHKQECGGCPDLEKKYKAGLEQGILKGRREVVGEMVKRSHTWEANTFNRQYEGLPSSYIIRTFEIKEDRWQAKLKEWGIKEHDGTANTKTD